VGEDGGLIAGHARILAARQLGIVEIPVMVAAGWTEAQKCAYVLADTLRSRKITWVVNRWSSAASRSLERRRGVTARWSSSRRAAELLPNSANL
jgi:hypothetical protein